MTHTFKYHTNEQTPGVTTVHMARCKCGFATEWHVQEWAVQDEITQHLDKIEKIKAYLGTKTPTLKAQRDYYRQMSRDPAVPGREQALWGQLADELSVRVNDETRWEDVQLPFGE